jgi:hypothetical protein
MLVVVMVVVVMVVVVVDWLPCAHERGSERGLRVRSFEDQETKRKKK